LILFLVRKIEIILKFKSDVYDGLNIALENGEGESEELTAIED
jgi:hypothetical protein